MGTQALDRALEAAQQAQAAIVKEKKQKETINRWSINDQVLKSQKWQLKKEYSLWK